MDVGVDAKRVGLKRSVLYSYCFFRLPLSPIDFTLRLTARTSIWQDTLKMSASSQASYVAATKSLDFLLGFIVGKTSDNLRTQLGRRRPFILLAFPLGLLAFLIFCNAAFFIGSTPEEAPCANLTLSSTSGNGSSCPALKACLDDAIARGVMWAPGNTSDLPSRTVNSGASAGLGAYFVVFYFCFIFFTWTCTQIPYDALGMELTDDYHERSFLFGVKVTFQFIGYILSPISGVILSSISTDVIFITGVRSIVFAILGVIAQLLLLANVRERPQRPLHPAGSLSATAVSKVVGSAAVDGAHQEPMAVPAIPSARRALANKPYVRYLWMKVPLTLFSLVPSNMTGFYTKYTLALEDWTFFESVLLIVALVGGLLAVPMSVKLARRLGKGHALSLLVSINAALFLVFMSVPYNVYRDIKWPLTMVVAFSVGLGTTQPFVLPDAILADIIDYDELRTGERNEGVYTVVETNLQQFVEIAGGVIPLMILGAAGYEPLGGCSCGCGIPCGDREGVPYARWICPDNVGYSCTGDVESPLLYGSEPDAVPCATQPVGVLWTIQLFMLGIPGVLGILAAVVARYQLITPQIHTKIREQLALTSKYPLSTNTTTAADNGACGQGAAAAATDEGGAPHRIDPFTEEPITLPLNNQASLRLEHMSAAEIRVAQHDGVGRLRWVIGGRLGLWLVISAGLIAAMAATGIEYLITAGCLVLTVLFVLIPWDAVRLHLLNSQGEEMFAPAKLMALRRAGGEDESMGLRSNCRL